MSNILQFMGDVKVESIADPSSAAEDNEMPIADVPKQPHDNIEVQVVEDFGKKSVPDYAKKSNVIIIQHPSTKSELKHEDIPKKPKLIKRSEKKKTVRRMPSALRVVTPKLKDSWIEQLESEKMVKCPLQKCELVFSTFGGIQYHYPQCTGDSSDLSYPRCDICNFLISRPRFVATHMFKVHGIKLEVEVKNKKPSMPKPPSDNSTLKTVPIENTEFDGKVQLANSNRIRKTPKRFLELVEDDEQNSHELPRKSSRMSDDLDIHHNKPNLKEEMDIDEDEDDSASCSSSGIGSNFSDTVRTSMLPSRRGPKRGRGRGRGSKKHHSPVLEKEDDEEFLEVPVERSRRGRGRPRGRGRGRGRSRGRSRGNHSPHVVSAMEDVEEQSPSSVTRSRGRGRWRGRGRGRGRGRRASLSETLKETSASPPRKTDIQGIHENPNQEAFLKLDPFETENNPVDKPKRKRGRPRRTISLRSPITINMNENEDSGNNSIIVNTEQDAKIDNKVLLEESDSVVCQNTSSCCTPLLQDQVQSILAVGIERKNEDSCSTNGEAKEHVSDNEEKELEELFAVPLKRRRGRQPKRKIGVCNTESVAKKKANQNASTANQSSKKLTCPLCLEEFPALPIQQYSQHIYRYHNGLMRKPDEKPYTVDEKRDILKICLKKVKALRCQNENCGKVFTTLGGFLYHEERCGIDPAHFDVTCDICGKIVKKASLYSHMKAIHPPSPVPFSTPGPDPDGKRKAAILARDSLKKLTTDLGPSNTVEPDSASEYSDKSTDDEENSESDSEKDVEESRSPNVVKIMATKSVLVHISKALYKEWGNELQQNGFIKCKNDNCNQQITNVVLMRKHFYNCKNSQTSLVQCNECDKRFKSVVTLRKHRRFCHRGNENDKSDNDFELGKRSKKCKSFQETVYSLSYKYSNRKFDCFKNTATPQFYNDNYSHLLFPDLKPNIENWKLLRKEVYQEYLPVCNRSAEFTSDSTHKENGNNYSDYKWETLNRFQSMSNQNRTSWTMFTGGPVKSCSWVPTSILDCDAHQYLAVSINHEMDTFIKMGESYRDKGIIELWSFACLNTQSDDHSPNLNLVIAHDAGIVWEILWCPSGCWEPEVTVHSDTVPPRLGLLACAHSDGCVRIFACPHPNSIGSPEPDSLRVCRPSPDVILKLTRETESFGNLQCVCMSWFQGKGHGKIAAGFNNGLVAIWDLTATSPLLVGQEERKKIIYALQVFRAHSSLVTGVDFNVGSDGRFLVTCSRDRHLKVWDRQNVCVPENSVFKKFLTNVRWNHAWSGIIYSEDNLGLQQNTIAVSYLENGYFHGNNTVVSYHNSCPLDSSVSLFHNAVVSCDYSGRVFICQLQNQINFQAKSQYRRLQQNLLRLKTVKKSKDSIVDSTAIPINYQESAQSYALVFEEMNLFSSKMPVNGKLLNKPMAMEYPITSINKVQWNTNVGYCNWIACGCQNGLLKIIRVGPVSNITKKIISDKEKVVAMEADKSR